MSEASKYTEKLSENLVLLSIWIQGCWIYCENLLV